MALFCRAFKVAPWTLRLIVRQLFRRMSLIRQFVVKNGRFCARMHNDQEDETFFLIARTIVRHDGAERSTSCRRTTRNSLAVQPMRVGPSESACRSRFQTTFGGCGQKPWS